MRELNALLAAATKKDTTPGILAQCIPARRLRKGAGLPTQAKRRSPPGGAQAAAHRAGPGRLGVLWVPLLLPLLTLQGRMCAAGSAVARTKILLSGRRRRRAPVLRPSVLCDLCSAFRGSAAVQEPEILAMKY